MEKQSTEALKLITRVLQLLNEDDDSYLMQYLFSLIERSSFDKGSIHKSNEFMDFLVQFMQAAGKLETKPPFVKPFASYSEELITEKLGNCFEQEETLIDLALYLSNYDPFVLERVKLKEALTHKISAHDCKYVGCSKNCKQHELGFPLISYILYLACSEKGHEQQMAIYMLSHVFAFE